MMRDSVFEIRFVLLKLASILLAPGDFGSLPGSGASMVELSPKA
jgi:hypothetical protein